MRWRYETSANVLNNFSCIRSECPLRAGSRGTKSTRIFTERSSFHREHLFYVITQNMRYTLRYLLANTSLNTHTEHQRIIPTITQLPLMQHNRPQHTCFASVPGSAHCADFRWIRVSPCSWLCTSLGYYFQRLCWLTDINTVSLQATNKTRTVWYLLPWRTFL